MIPQHIIAAVTEERTCQDARWGGAAHDDQHTRAEWIALLARHVGLAMPDGGEDDALSLERYRRQLVRTAALAVAALESLDRKGQWERPAALTHPGNEV